jgi:hypothetical protein
MACWPSEIRSVVGSKGGWQSMRVTGERAFELAIIGLSGAIVLGIVDVVVRSKADLDGFMGFAGGLIGAFGAVFLTTHSHRKQRTDEERREHNLIAGALKATSNEVKEISARILRDPDDDEQHIRCTREIRVRMGFLKKSLDRAEQYATTINFLMRAMLGDWPSYCDALSDAARKYESAIVQCRVPDSSFDLETCELLRAKLLFTIDDFIEHSCQDVAIFSR